MTISLLVCGALVSGCGSDSPGVITPDAGEDVAADGKMTSDVMDAPPQPVDVQPKVDTMPPPGDVGADVMGDAPPSDVPPPDAPADVAVDVVMDASVDDVADVLVVTDSTDVGDVTDATVMLDVPPSDGPVVDVPRTDACTTGPCPGMVRGHRGTSLVSSGEVMRSPSYRMVSTLGQSSIHQSVMQSAGYRLRGGLVGATEGSR